MLELGTERVVSLSEHGEMWALVRAYNWASTPLGAAESWPASLKAATDLVLGCEFPMIVLWGPSLVQIYNDGYRALMAKKHPLGLGQPTRECWPEVWHINEPIYARVWRGESVTLTNQLFPITRHGYPEEAYFTLCYSPLRDETGQVAGVLVTVFETTAAVERARAEAALRESEERFRALVSATSYVVYRMSPDWTEMRQLDGRGFISDTRSPSKSWLQEYIFPEDQPHVMQVIRQAVQSESIFELEHRVRRVDGTVGWTLSRAVPLLDDNGEISEWFGAASDVTERKLAEERLQEARMKAALRQTDERFRALVGASSDVLYRMSPTWSEMRHLGGGRFLATTEEPSKDWLQKYIPSEDQPLVLETIQKAVRSKSVFELEHRVRRADGSLGWTLSRAVPLLDAGGEIVEWFGAASDITARRQAEQEVRDSLAEREVLLKEVHHRVKNNLQVITSLLELQASQVEDPCAFELFQEACNRVASIACLHELVYRSGSFAEIELAPYAAQLVQRLVHFYRAEERMRVAVTGGGGALELERAIPFGLLLNELVSNACKHAFPNKRTGVLAVRLGQERGNIRLEVADTGVGLPKHVDYRKSPALGLQLVRKLADHRVATRRSATSATTNGTAHPRKTMRDASAKAVARDHRRVD